MPILYCWSGATGTATGADWANAKTTLTAAFATEVAGDTIFVAHDHAESTAGTVTLTSSGTIANPTKVICVNRAGTVPPVSADRRATASVATTGSNVLSITGFTHYDGIVFVGASGGTAHLQVHAGTGNQSVRLDNCSLRLASSGAASRIRIGGGGGTQGGAYVELNNTTVSFAVASQGLNINGVLKWRNTPSALLGTIPTQLFFPETTIATGGEVECIGVDLSAVGSGKTIAGSSSTNINAFKYRFMDCKLDAAVTKSAVPSTQGNCEVEFVRCGSSGNYAVTRHHTPGLLTEETTIVRSGGASDGTTPLAWKIITTANCTYSMPFECPPVGIWCDALTPQTATIEGIWGGGALPNDDEIWLETEFLGSGTSPQASFVADCKSDLLASAAAQTASGATWDGTVALTATTWSTTDKNVNVTLSNDNLTATTTNSPAGWRAIEGKTAGKFYFELTATTIGGINLPNIGLTQSSASLTSNTGAVNISTATGAILVSGSGSAFSIGAIVSGDIVGIAVDLTAGLFWCRKAPSGDWNGNATHNPATGAGGVSFNALLGPALHPHGNAGWSGHAITANFGATAFVGAVPAGFTSGWGIPPSRFKLSTPFTAQQAGLVYARVKVAKPSAAFYIDPKVTLAPLSVTYTTWDAATATAVTLSGGNLVATNTGTTSADQGARVANTAGKTTGKYYFEVLFTNIIGDVDGLRCGIGDLARATYANQAFNAAFGTMVRQSGAVYTNGSFTLNLTPVTSGGGYGFAVDLDNRKIWVRTLPAGEWLNGSIGFQNPATNTGGQTVTTGSIAPYCTFGGTGGSAGNVFTANFGVSTFVGAVPSGFTAGWTTGA